MRVTVRHRPSDKSRGDTIQKWNTYSQRTALESPAGGVRRARYNTAVTTPRYARDESQHAVHYFPEKQRELPTVAPGRSLGSLYVCWERGILGNLSLLTWRYFQNAHIFGLDLVLLWRAVQGSLGGALHEPGDVGHVQEGRHFAERRREALRLEPANSHLDLKGYRWGDRKCSFKCFELSEVTRAIDGSQSLTP